MKGDSVSGGRRWRSLWLSTCSGIAIVEKAGPVLRDVRMSMQDGFKRNTVVTMTPNEARVLARRLLQLANEIDAAREDKVFGGES
jgi:hypothetical protein